MHEHLIILMITIYTDHEAMVMNIKNRMVQTGLAKGLDKAAYSLHTY